METISIILSSAFIATVLSSLVTIYVSRLGYKDKYYEKLIDKRLQSHEEIGVLITLLKTSVQDTDNSDRRTYHQIFAMGYDDFCKITASFAGDNHSFWVTNRTTDALIKINREFFRCHLLYKELDNDLVEVGRREYEEVARLRDELEDSLLTDLPTLHKIDDFLKEKSVEKEISVVDLKRRPSENES